MLLCEIPPRLQKANLESDGGDGDADDDDDGDDDDEKIDGKAIKSPDYNQTGKINSLCSSSFVQTCWTTTQRSGERQTGSFCGLLWVNCRFQKLLRRSVLVLVSTFWPVIYYPFR